MNIEDKIIQDADEAQRISRPKDKGTYEKDGLLYCEECNTPVQYRVTILGVDRIVHCACRCEAERLKKEREEREHREEMDRIERFRKLGFQDARLHEMTFANDDGSNPRLMTLARKYVDNWPRMIKEGRGLLFYGTVGTGKTYAAASIANELTSRGVPCMVTNFGSLINRISSMQYNRQDYIDGLQNFRLLVIDDLASERNTEYANEIVFNVIDARYRQGLPLIVTTNLSGAELKDAGEIRKERVYSRLLEMCFPFEVKGADRRRQKLKDEYAETKKLLGL